MYMYTYIHTYIVYTHTVEGFLMLFIMWRLPICESIYQRLPHYIIIRWKDYILQLLNSTCARKGSQTKDNIQSPVTPGINVVEINVCLITPPPKGNIFATLNIERRGRRGYGKRHI